MIAFVICLNDFPQHVVIGSLEQATVKKDELATVYEATVGSTELQHWHIREVDLTDYELTFTYKDQREILVMQLCYVVAMSVISTKVNVEAVGSLQQLVEQEGFSRSVDLLQRITAFAKEKGLTA